MGYSDRGEWLRKRGTGESLQKFYRSRERYIHVSARAGMQPNPFDPQGPRVPWVQKPGVTYRRPAA